MNMTRYTANGSASGASRFLGGGAFTWLAALMLATLAQPATAQVMIPDVTAQLEAADIEVVEGDDAIFKLSLSRSFDFDIRYAYQTQDATAKAGKDYEAQKGYVVFAAGPVSMRRSGSRPTGTTSSTAPKISSLCCPTWRRMATEWSGSSMCGPSVGVSKAFPTRRQCRLGFATVAQAQPRSGTSLEVRTLAGAVAETESL